MNNVLAAGIRLKIKYLILKVIEDVPLPSVINVTSFFIIITSMI